MNNNIEVKMEIGQLARQQEFADIIGETLQQIGIMLKQMSTDLREVPNKYCSKCGGIKSVETRQQQGEYIVSHHICRECRDLSFSVEKGELKQEPEQTVLDFEGKTEGDDVKAADEPVCASEGHAECVPVCRDCEHEDCICPRAEVSE